MSREEKTMLDLIRNKAREVVPAGARVYLFGSHARGDSHPDSDWDILILMDQPCASMADCAALSYPFTELGWKYGENIIPVIYGKDEWAHPSSLLFRRNVERDAISLV